MKTDTMDYKLVDFIPEKLESGVLYISEKYKTAAHKCCCGCGEEVITPLNPTGWSAKISNNCVTLYPSIGNWGFACRSHYWINRGRIEWSYQMSEWEIQRGRDTDRRLKKQYYSEPNGDNTSQPSRPGSDWLESIIGKIKSWLGL